MTEINKLLYQADEIKNTTTCPECDQDVDDSLIIDNICPSCGRKMKLITMQEYGQLLPIGILKEVDNKEVLMKDFTIDDKGIGFVKEKNISDFWNKYARSKQVTAVDYVSVVLAHCVNSMGGQDISSYSIEKKMAINNQMYIGDIFYMYAWLRYCTLGSAVNLDDIKCIKCNNDIKHFSLDLGSLEIRTIDTSEDLYNKVELKDGFILMNKLCKNLLIKPPTFYSVTGIKDINSATALGEFTKTSIYKIEDFEQGVVVTDKEIEQLTKTDMNILDDEINYASAGPNWSMEIKCPHCEQNVFYTIDWTYTDFFARSSLVTRKKRLRR